MVISYMHTDRQRQAVAILFPQFMGQTHKQGTQTPAPTPSLESVNGRVCHWDKAEEVCATERRCAKSRARLQESRKLERVYVPDRGKRCSSGKEWRIRSIVHL